MNTLPEVLTAFGPFGLASGGDLLQAARRLGEGIALLAAAWPDAYATLRRHIQGIVLLARRDHERSHTPATLPKAVLLTAGRPARDYRRPSLS